MDNIFSLSNDDLMIIDKLVDLCSDYRQDDGFIFDRDHVIEWIKQFESDHSIILRGTLEVLEKQYISKQTILNSYDNFVKTNIKTFQNYPPYLLDIQIRGESQSYFVNIFKQFLSKYNLSYNDFKLVGLDIFNNHTYTSRLIPQGSLLLYLDDCSFTGNHIVQDINSLFNYAKDTEWSDKISLAIVTFASNASSEYYINKKINEKIKYRTINIVLDNIIPNYKNNHTKKLGVLWPMKINSEIVTNFENKLKDSCIKDYHKNKIPYIFRETNIIDQNFKESSTRDIIEKHYLIEGIKIINGESNPKANKKPLGYDYNPTLGFGSFLINYRNCPNNAPLVLWYGEKGFCNPNHPFANWYPLFPRKTNC